MSGEYIRFIVKTGRGRGGGDPGVIIAGLPEQKKAIDGRGPQFADIVKMLQAIASSQRPFM